MDSITLEDAVHHIRNLKTQEARMYFIAAETAVNDARRNTESRNPDALPHDLRLRRYIQGERAVAIHIETPLFQEEEAQ